MKFGLIKNRLVWLSVILGFLIGIKVFAINPNIDTVMLPSGVYHQWQTGNGSYALTRVHGQNGTVSAILRTANGEWSFPQVNPNYIYFGGHDGDRLTAFGAYPWSQCAWVKKTVANTAVFYTQAALFNNYISMSEPERYLRSDGGGSSMISTNGAYPASKWFFLAMTYDGFTKHFYVNARQCTTLGTTAAGLTAHEQRYGANAGSQPANYFGGLTSEIVTYAGKDLTADELHQIMHLTGTSEQLIDAYEFSP